MEKGVIFALESFFLKLLESFLHIADLRVVDEQVAAGFNRRDVLDFFVLRVDFCLCSLVLLLSLLLLFRLLCRQFFNKFVQVLGKVFFLDPFPSALLRSHLFAVFPEECVLFAQFRVNLVTLFEHLVFLFLLFVVLLVVVLLFLFLLFFLFLCLILRLLFSLRLLSFLLLSDLFIGLRVRLFIFVFFVFCRLIFVFFVFIFVFLRAFSLLLLFFLRVFPILLQLLFKLQLSLSI
jgi:hypothetical protein